MEITQINKQTTNNKKKALAYLNEVNIPRSPTLKL